MVSPSYTLACKILYTTAKLSSPSPSSPTSTSPRAPHKKHLDDKTAPAPHGLYHIFILRFCLYGSHQPTPITNYKNNNDNYNFKKKQHCHTPTLSPLAASNKKMTFILPSLYQGKETHSSLPRTTHRSVLIDLNPGCLSKEKTALVRTLFCFIIFSMSPCVSVDTLIHIILVSCRPKLVVSFPFPNLHTDILPFSFILFYQLC